MPGVTFVGAREQIHKQLIARGDIPADQLYPVSVYIAKTVRRKDLDHLLIFLSGTLMYW